MIQSVKATLQVFDVVLERKPLGLVSFNGYFRAKSYQKHLNHQFKCFKHSLFYELSLDSKVDKSVFLKHLHQELQDRQRYLQTPLWDKPFQDFKRIWFKDKTYKGLRLMYYRQVRKLDEAIQVVEYTAETLGYELNPTQQNTVLLPLHWTGGELALIQLYQALKHTNKYIQVFNDNDWEVLHQIGQLLNINITQNGRTALSRALHSSNRDYVPTVIKDIKKAYQSYELQILSSKK